MKQHKRISVVDTSFFSEHESSAVVKRPEAISDSLAKVTDSLNKIAAVIARVGYSEAAVVLDTAGRIESVLDNPLAGPDVSS